MWPLFALAPGGYVITACYDSDTISIFRLFEEDGEVVARLGPAIISAREPAGIRSIGAITMDTAPDTASFLVLDRAAARIVAFPWPPSEDDLQNLGMARKPRPVEGIRRVVPGGSGEL